MHLRLEGISEIMDSPILGQALVRSLQKGSLHRLVSL